MVTHTMPLTEAQKAFETLESYADGVGKIVLVPAG
jgi:threonine dehydrogenase-like Zn-dependent dehydrogenase